jgi:hypothetical protein
MDGDLTAAPAGQSPTFMIRALRDVDGANLDRIQIIKGWLNGQGQTHERVYDGAVSDDRTIDADGRCKTPVGNTVDVANTTWTTASVLRCCAGTGKTRAAIPRNAPSTTSASVRS